MSRVKIEKGAAPHEAAAPLHVRYRPRVLDEVVGQPAAVKALKGVIGSKALPHSYLFTGPSGTGKTTLARIVANHLAISPGNLVEVDAATNNGIDDMREVTAALQYQGFGTTPCKMIIIDECHALSKAAWQSLLKSVEEPPAHVFWAFCTTEPSKVPDTIRTRCVALDLKPVRRDDLFDLLAEVAKDEDLDVSDKHLDMIAGAANGSPRQALVYLASIAGVTDTDEVADILSVPGENPEIIDLCRLLVSGRLSWEKVTGTIKALDMPAESIRIVIVNYLASCLMGAKGEKQVCSLLAILDCFSKPYNSSDKMAPLLLAFGDLIYPPN